MFLLSEKIKALREEKGFSQEEFATKLCVVRQTVSKWENGLSLPDAEMLVKIAEVLDTSVGTLVGEDCPQNEECDELTHRVDGQPKQKRSVLSIILLVLGFPVWGSLALSAVAVVVSLYAAWWSVVVSLWASFGALIGGAVGGIVSGFGIVCGGESLSGIALFGISLVVAGFGILLFFGCKEVTKRTGILTRKFIIWLKNRFHEKEGAK